MILGIECTAHTFGIAVVDKGKVLSNVRDMFTTTSGGIIPMEAAKHHEEVAQRVFIEAINIAGIAESDINAIALSNAPGLAPCLIAGMKFAKKKALEFGIPIVSVNHCIAHLEIARTAGAKDPVLLYASGANTQIIAYTEGYAIPRMRSTLKPQKVARASGKYRIFGETLDIGIGNFIDKFARHTGLGFPGGPKLELEAKKSKHYIELPYSIKGMDVSFSGMQTKLQQLYDRGEKIEDLAFSMQETAFAMLVEAAERALAHTGKKELALGGGVACNSRLQEMCRIMCRERGAKFFCPEKQLLVDNAGMIGYLGEIMFNKGIKEKPENVDIKPRERTDQVDVKWK